jgi:hypothetical protein
MPTPANVFPTRLSGSLFVIFHNLARPDFRFVRVFTKLAQGSPLAQKIPALIQLDFEVSQALLITVLQFRLSVQVLFFFHQAIDVIQYGNIVLRIRHEQLLSDIGPLFGAGAGDTGLDAGAQKKAQLLTR